MGFMFELMYFNYVKSGNKMFLCVKYLLWYIFFNILNIKNGIWYKINIFIIIFRVLVVFCFWVILVSFLLIVNWCICFVMYLVGWWFEVFECFLLFFIRELCLFLDKYFLKDCLYLFEDCWDMLVLVLYFLWCICNVIILWFLLVLLVVFNVFWLIFKLWICVVVVMYIF